MIRQPQPRGWELSISALAGYPDQAQPPEVARSVRFNLQSRLANGPAPKQRISREKIPSMLQVIEAFVQDIAVANGVLLNAHGECS